MLRITGGSLKGRLIRAPSHTHTRPTQARTRQSLFNSIQADVPEARVLDLFAGSGGLGFEALSRGAREAVFVEKDKGTCRLIQKNAEELGVTQQVRVLQASLEENKVRWSSYGAFDLILADPPYGSGWETQLLPWLARHELVVAEGLIIIEWAPREAKVSEIPSYEDAKIRFSLLKEKTYGDTQITIFQTELKPLEAAVETH